uniref:F-box domain-containing protein n=1 Tax=Leersia perrieri TaxID=77586 RepID=A0A0D9W308_9ORYZ
MASDRLSALPDRLLRRVLSFAPVRQAGRSSLLSRRWRTLWQQSGSVTIKANGTDGDEGGNDSRLLFGATLATAKPGGIDFPVRKLVVDVYDDFQVEYIYGFFGMRSGEGNEGLHAILAAPGVQSLEELYIICSSEFCRTVNAYELLPGRLPYHSLRVLDIDGITVGALPAAALFVRLETLRIKGCEVSIESIQAILDATPNLARLWLERPDVVDRYEYQYGLVREQRACLHCPSTVTAVVLHHCLHLSDGIYLDAPGARSLHYTGFLHHFPSMTTAAHLEHIDLTFCTRNRCVLHPSWISPLPLAYLWKSIGSFRHAQVLKFNAKIFDRSAVVDLSHDDKMLMVLPYLSVLEIEGCLDENDDSTAFGVLDRPQLNKSPELALESSMDLLARLKSGKTYPCDEVDDDGGIGDNIGDELCALKERSFPCLESHLKRIRFDFQLVHSIDCFEVRLIRFFAENAKVLDEMVVSDGDHRVYDHIHHKLARWRAMSLQTKNVIAH